MDKLLFAVMFALIIFIGFKNATLIKRYKQNKTYIDTYQKVLRNDENSYDEIKNYIENEKSEEFKNKAKVIKLYCELNSNAEYKDTLSDIDLKAIFYSKGKVDSNLAKVNTDAFIFMILALTKAYDLRQFDAIEIMANKLRELEGLETRLEYKETLDIADVLIDKSNDLTMFKSLLEGTYTSYQYDKNIIGLYKRMASTMLAFKNVDFDEYYKNDLHSFAKSTIGNIVMKNLGIYETYKPIEEETPEVQQEEIQEDNNKENEQ